MPESADWLTYANSRAIRNQPLSDRLTKALGFLPDMGVTMKVFSGGQEADGPHRTGSHRHDGGGAGDVFFYKDGRQLDWANRGDLPIFQDIVRRARANGVTGFGAGEGYMQPGSMHIGFGAPAVWGAGGRGANAAGWLTEAFNSPPSAAPAVNAANGLAAERPTQVASLDPSIGATPSPPSMGGLTQAAVDDYASKIAAGLPAQADQPAPIPSPLPVGTPMATTEKGARVVRTLTDPQPIGGAPMPMQGTPAPVEPPQIAQAQTDLSRVSPMAGGTGGVRQPGAQPTVPMDVLMRAAGNPWLNENQRAVVNMLLKQQLDAADPSNALDTEYKRAQIDALRRRGGSLINAGNGNIYDPQTGSWITAPAGADSDALFDGKSVQAQGLNYLIRTGQLTKEQAAQLAAGKTITDPATGAITFMTPQGLVTQPGAGAGDGQNGSIPLTGPKKPTDTEYVTGLYADRMATSGQIIDDLEAAGTSLKDNLAGRLPFGNYAISEDFQKFDQAQRDFINAVLRRESGAVISPDEFDNARKQYLPQPGDSAEVLKQKRRNRQIAIDGMKRAAGPSYGAQPSSPPQDDGWQDVGGVKIRRKQ